MQHYSLGNTVHVLEPESNSLGGKKAFNDQRYSPRGKLFALWGLDRMTPSRPRILGEGGEETRPGERYRPSTTRVGEAPCPRLALPLLFLPLG